MAGVDRGLGGESHERSAGWVRLAPAMEPGSE
jgi:hypothetical protein